MWPQQWSSETPPKELPRCALSVSFSSVSPASVPAPLALFHLLSYFCRQRPWQSGEKNVRIPWDPLVFQVCLALADRWLNTLSGAPQKVVAASFFRPAHFTGGKVLFVLILPSAINLCLVQLTEFRNVTREDVTREGAQRMFLYFFWKTAGSVVEELVELKCRLS